MRLGLNVCIGGGGGKVRVDVKRCENASKERREEERFNTYQLPAQAMDALMPLLLDS